MPAVVINLRLVKVGFKPAEMMKAQARGRVFDPTAIIRVEVVVQAESKADLFTSQTIALVRNAVNQVKFRGGRVAGKAVCRQVRGGWVRDFDVD